MDCSYKFRLYPNATQEDLIQRTFGCTRFVYNHYLAQRMEQYYSTGNSPTRFQQDKDLTQLKKELDWLREVDKCALQNALKDLNTAFLNFFRGLKNGSYIGYPKFKSKRDHRKSYKTNNNGSTIYVSDNAVKLPKLGLIKCAISKKINGRILSATVSQTPSGKYYVSLCCTDVETKKLPSTGAVVGVDLGIKDLAITSEGVKYQNNQYTQSSEKKLARLKRQLSRKSKGSKRYEKARVKVARLQEHVANQRRDAMQKLTTELINNYDVICIEDLNVKGMVRNHHLSKAVSDSAFSEFRRELEYKAAWYGKTVSIVDRFFPSSQLCSNCGVQWRGAKDLSIRSWTCPACGKHHDRDLNAAINILNEGLRLLS